MKRGLVRFVAITVAANALIWIVLAVLRRRMPPTGDEGSDEIARNAIGQGIEFQSHARAFRGGSARAIMGGLRLDLRQASLAPDGATLETLAVLGGIQVLVPSGWSIRLRDRRTILGGITGPAREQPYPGAPTLYVDGTAVLGGVQVSE